MPRDGASFFKEDRVRGLYEFEIKKVSYHYYAGACQAARSTLPYIKYVFYDAQISTMGITNTQSGLMLTMYTIGNMILYIPGGIIADKVSPKKALVISLLSTTALAYIYAFSMNFAVAMVIWLGLSFSTAFVFWSSLMKAIRIIGTEEEQGFMYGLYYACNGITGALTNTLALNVYKTARR